MKTFFCLLLLSITALSQTKNTQRYQIVECKPIDEKSTIFLVDGETGKTWQLRADTLVTASGSGSVADALSSGRDFLWMPVPFYKISGFFHSPKIFTIEPQENKK